MRPVSGLHDITPTRHPCMSLRSRKWSADASKKPTVHQVSLVQYQSATSPLILSSIKRCCIKDTTYMLINIASSLLPLGLICMRPVKLHDRTSGTQLQGHDSQFPSSGFLELDGICCVLISQTCIQPRRKSPQPLVASGRAHHHWAGYSICPDVIRSSGYGYPPITHQNLKNTTQRIRVVTIFG